MSKIVIVGAGYAGMMAATRLERLAEPFTIINKHAYHYFTTLLHEAAGGRGEPDKYRVDIKEVLAKPSSELVVTEVTGIDRERRVVRTEAGEFPYEYLVFTLGWVPEYFGIPGLAEHSLVLRSLNAAKQIRSHIEREFRQYREDQNPVHLRIVVGGAGLTGVELVGELLDWLPELCMTLGVPWDHVEVQNIEAMPMILPMVAENLREVAARTLTEKGAKLRINTKIVQVTPGRVHLEGGEVVEAGTIIWTGGVRANPLLEQAGFTVDRRGRAKVNEYLQSVDDPHVFVGGDSAWCDGPDGRPYPPTAQVASQMGRAIADNVHALVHGRPMKPFQAHLKGTLASLGRELGVGDMVGVPVKGVVAAVAKEASKVKYLLELGGVRLAAAKSGELVHL
ncbi:NADH dehydrogenase-like protein YjlD [Alicyclobacillus cellulosilyticus]|uniref:NADH dehydrogenase-like protein YjlD n=1 Tax=Alicyclobacillus cellulosilyticus TaxID=1003997 RepID=A0A917KJG5_9BACL|nr:NAD(P)/FAD-dependent oxidoreductase [Alicyclobacillus cellulosilyticus]GGJ14185.1 NADH dehydrogenase-like protein YjlD [Alicyclobacillus cellulosilyticus]